ncbi:PPC domain-containing DNA-binding protein [Tianweitania sediminis]|uniref:PPC domain-containing DNA-binding protein n=1 Tax=Tianweitania sediminis TaxID=1502156 RepID=UPI0036103390
MRTILAVLEKGDEAMDCLRRLAEVENISAAQLTALGAFRTAELSFFEWDTKEYLSIPVNEQVEVATMVGDIALDGEGKPAVHVHAVLGKRDGRAIAGHLARGEVRPTLEVVITETEAHLHRVKDDETGLPLIKPHRAGP